MLRLAVIFCLCLAVNPEEAGQTPQQPAPLRLPVQTLSEKTVGTVTLKPVVVLDGELALLIPDGFAVMDEETLKVKYPGANRPALVYSNNAGSINVAIKYTQDRVAADQLTALHKEIDASVRRQVSGATWLFSGFQHINARKWMQLEFVSPALDTRIHNIMVATSVNQRMMLVSFNVTEELAEQWLEPGREIIRSLSVRD